MNGNVLKTTVSSLVSLIVGCCLAGSSSRGATPDLVLLKAKQDAEAKGYVFVTTHDEIMAGAKKEGGLRLLGSLSPETYKILTAAFKKHYPFIEVYAEEFKSTDAHQPFLLELKAGRARNWDVFVMAPDFYAEYVPHTKRFDILGMAMQRVLAIPPAMIDPKNRTIVSMASSIFGIAYNRKQESRRRNFPKIGRNFSSPNLKEKNSSLIFVPWDSPPWLLAWGRPGPRSTRGTSPRRILFGFVARAGHLPRWWLESTLCCIWLIIILASGPRRKISVVPWNAKSSNPCQPGSRN